MKTINKLKLFGNIPLKLFSVFSIVILIASCTLLPSQKDAAYRIQDHSLFVKTDLGEIKYSALPGGSIEVQYLQENVKQLPSYSKIDSLKTVKAAINLSGKNITFVNGELKAVIDKSDLSVSFYQNSKFLVTQNAYFLDEKKRGFSFQLDSTEKVMGGGERVLGMDRRGHRMPLYNRAHYGYTTESNQMNFSLPAIMSSKKYAILFDNTANGFLDIGKTKSDTLSFEAVGGRTAYIMFSGETFPKLINQYVNVTGKQPLPPRWAFGNFASRFGYKSQQQVSDTIDQFIDEDFPVDAIILDLYWFGNDIKGFMGNLDWDKDVFPQPVEMMSELKKKGVKTILITEPFVLSSSNKWQDAVDNKVLAKDTDGNPKRFDFYFGNTGLIDLFDVKAQKWFDQIYTDLTNQGVDGVWGDLGEPEVHPADTVHFISEINDTVTGDEIHNAYGHQWAKTVFENQLAIKPETRPFLLMRSGFAGSQRYGMIPWTGDVSRSWGGLKPQVELSLQMGLLGLGYTHSDLGGFAGGEKFDQELYIRWLQYGVFQPIYRPHAQDNIAPEPIFHDKQTKDILREYVKLRYQLLPYNYTLAYENSTTGMPLMRPLFFENDSELSAIDNKETYLWGDAFLVSPVTEPNKKKQRITLPKGVWFDYWNGQRYQGEETVDISLSLETLPVLVRAGSFIPMVESVQSTRDYSSKNLTLHYYADKSVAQSDGKMYEDDGASYNAIADGKFELLKFSAIQSDGGLQIELSRSGSGYQGIPKMRKLDVVIHHWLDKPKSILYAGMELAKNQYSYDVNSNRLTISFDWDHSTKQLEIKL